MRWPFGGSSIVEYLALFAQCLDVPIDERDSLVAEVRTHLEEATEAIAGPRQDAEVHATQALGSPRDLAARISLARRHRRPARVLVIDPPLQYEAPGEPIRLRKRDLGWTMGMLAYPPLTYWMDAAVGRNPLPVAFALLIVAAGVMAGRWTFARLTPTEVTRVVLWFTGLGLALGCVNAILFFSRVVRADVYLLWAAPFWAFAAIVGLLEYRRFLRVPASDV